MFKILNRCLIACKFTQQTSRCNSQLVRNTLIDTSFGLNDDQRQLQETALNFAKNELQPFMRKWDEEHIFPIETLRKAAELGFAALYTPVECGGTGLSRLDTSIVIEALSQGCISTTAFLSIHNMVTWMIGTFGNDDQKSRYVSDLCTMKKIASYCLTEPGSGSDAASLITSAKREGDYYILNGSKCFISGGGGSDLLLVFARTGDKGPKGISAFIIDGDSEGIIYGKNERKMGWNSQPTRMVMFENCKVPAKNILGKEGIGFNLAMKGLNGGRINIASCSLGGAQRAIEETIEYVTVRKQFNKRIADFQNTQFQLAAMSTELVAARLLVRNAASALDALESGDTNAPAVSMASGAKLYATERCFYVIDGCLQLFGGYGYLYDYPLQQLLRDCRVHRILEGTNEMMKLIISRELLPLTSSK